MESPPQAKFLEQFRVAAGEGAVVELKLRLLADKLPSLQRLAHAPQLEEIENEVAIQFANALGEEEKATLSLCRQLRNKILHCNFSVARERLGDLGVEPQSAGVRKIDLAEVNPNEMRAKIERAVAESQCTLVSAAPTKQPGSVFGWLLEAGAAGDFLKAASAFRSASAIVDRLASEGGHGA
ncbi:hypothetical protein GALL_202380 [mine drainage metagenome]|uniref:Uncharacterized protein n=1 Tax=mine drainage metagenome TaxID=410659 RepID=A0A1J5RNF8_9ZZZZ